MGDFLPVVTLSDITYLSSLGLTFAAAPNPAAAEAPSIGLFPRNTLTDSSIHSSGFTLAHRAVNYRAH